MEIAELKKEAHKQGIKINRSENYDGYDLYYKDRYYYHIDYRLIYSLEESLLKIILVDVPKQLEERQKLYHVLETFNFNSYVLSYVLLENTNRHECINFVLKNDIDRNIIKSLHTTKENKEIFEVWILLGMDLIAHRTYIIEPEE